GGHGIVGGHLPLAVGAAFASKYRKEDRVTVVFYGEGASSIGASHEGMSLAALWKLPVIFICENNEYAMGTSIERSMSVTEVAVKADAYGMAKDRFTVSNVFEVRDRVKAAVDRARAGEGPTLIEMLTYRYRGHSMSDPAKYRTKEDVAEHKKLDSINLLETQLEEAGKKAELARIREEVEATIADCIEFAEESPEPGPEILAPTTYAGEFAR
ncbi:MAG: thiamine pyrophosphate-dependent enzyme, partial [Myxococcota bacterium]